MIQYRIKGLVHLNCKIKSSFTNPVFVLMLYTLLFWMTKGELKKVMLTLVYIMAVTSIKLEKKKKSIHSKFSEGIRYDKLKLNLLFHDNFDLCCRSSVHDCIHETLLAPQFIPTYPRKACHMMNVTLLHLFFKCLMLVVIHSHYKEKQDNFFNY